MDSVREIKTFIEGLNKSYTIPSTMWKILNIVRDEHSSPKDLYNVISHDQGFAERVMRVSNSALFGHSGHIKDLNHAIMFLGYEKIKSIALGLMVIDIFPWYKPFDIKKLWVHAYEVAYIASEIAAISHIIAPSEGFLCGLMHDIGRVILYKKDSSKFFEIGTNDDMLKKEMEFFGCTHAQASGWYLECARLPKDIFLPITYHHQPTAAVEFKPTTYVVSLAEGLSRRFASKIEDDGIWTEEHDKVMQELSLNEEHITMVGEKLEKARFEISDFFWEIGLTQSKNIYA